jgi:hypothetical protein
LWLGIASPDKRLDTLRENRALQLTIARSNAGLLGQSGFLRLLGGSKSRNFAAVRPAVLERVQRRANLRYQIDLPLNFRHLDLATREPRGKASPASRSTWVPAGCSSPLKRGQGSAKNWT